MKGCDPSTAGSRSVFISPGIRFPPTSARAALGRYPRLCFYAEASTRAAAALRGAPMSGNPPPLDYSLGGWVASCVVCSRFSSSFRPQLFLLDGCLVPVYTGLYVPFVCLSTVSWLGCPVLGLLFLVRRCARLGTSWSSVISNVHAPPN